MRSCIIKTYCFFCNGSGLGIFYGKCHICNGFGTINKIYLNLKVSKNPSCIISKTLNFDLTKKHEITK